ncbi:hypothetical protein [Armatimonas sp.]|uniref:hypothetical protein n=1 Tax=Armatimonas sp. TaxID=1872638 RepID=UPI00286BA302|nr:hypothetical protein [Armatimonas sp.]
MPHVASDDLDVINNGGSEAAIQHWAQLPQDEQLAQLERIKAIVKGGDDFIDVPLPMVATTATTAAAEALATYQAERQIVDGRLAQGVTLGVKALSFTDMCAELTRKTGVKFSAAANVADDNVTVFCTKRPVRDLMREITNLFGFTWTRSGQPDEYNYRLTQPVKAQLAEQELRNQNRNTIVYFNTIRSPVKAGEDAEWTVRTQNNELAIIKGEFRSLDVQRVVPEDIKYSKQPGTQVGTPEASQVVLDLDLNTLDITGRIIWGSSLTLTPSASSSSNAKRNKALKLLPELLRKVTIAPVPGEREPRLPGESAPEPLVTTADLLEAIHHATGKDTIGDSFTKLQAPQRVTAKNLPLFDALNTVCEPLGLQWGQERGWFSFRSASFYSDRVQEVPSRFLQRWAMSRRMNRGLVATDLAEIATLRDEQLDSGFVGSGVRVIQNLQEWNVATNATLRPHWRFFASLTPEQQKSALTAEGLGFRALRQAQQWELLRLAFEKKDNVSSVATQLGTIRLCVEKTRFVYHYTRPDGTPSEVVISGGPS